MLGQTTPSYSLGFKGASLLRFDPPPSPPPPPPPLLLLFCLLICLFLLLLFLIRPTNFTNKLLIIRSYISWTYTHSSPAICHEKFTPQWLKKKKIGDKNYHNPRAFSSMTWTQRWAVLRNVLSNPWHQIHFSDVKMKGEKRAHNAVWAHKTSVSHGV